MNPNKGDKMNYILWYTKPAQSWLEGLPIGNGRLAAMVHGGESYDQLSLNHEWLWRGVNKERENTQVAEHLHEIRALLQQDKFYEGTQLANHYLGGAGGVSGKKNRVDSYQPAGDLYFEIKQFKSYIKRQLDIKGGVVEGERELETGKVTSTFIADPQSSLIFGRWHAVEGTFSGVLSFSRVADEEAITQCDVTENSITFKCSFNSGIDYQVEVSIQTDGKVEVLKGLSIIEATELIVSVNIATSVKGIEKELKQYPKPNTSWNKLVNSTRQSFEKVFECLTLEVETEARNLPTDERIRRVKEGEEDPDLIALYFNYGRYLLIASSIKGELPANLQGKWNDQINPPWESDYHFDINLQMNYWMVEKGNMSECAEALLKYVERFIPHAKKAARQLYGCRGIYLPLQTDAWGRATPEAYGWAVWIGAAPWIAQHFWWHYLYTGDQNFLKTRAYPIFKEIASFYEDYLVEDEKGIYQIMPSQSPENRFEGTKEWPVSIGISSAMDVQLAYDALRYAIESAEVLEVDEVLVKKWKSIQQHLPPFALGEDGRLLEWEKERREVEPGHRHLSHLYGVFPSDLFNPIDRPEQFEAAKKSLEYRLEQGGGHTGWSRAWVACLAARMGEADQLWDHMNGLIRDFATSTLLDLHPPKIFQIDGNLGAVAAILEGMVQTWGGKTHLLRALPKAWPKGKLLGVKVPGGHVLDLEWNGKQLVNLQVTIGYSGQIILADLADLFEEQEGVRVQGKDILLKGEKGTTFKMIKVS